MVDWPDTAEVKKVLDVSDESWDDILDRVLAAAIAKVMLDVGDWDETTDAPDEALAQAALRMAELLAQRPDANPDQIFDPTYTRLLYGHRRQFGIA